ncbi:hypothetical protein AWJ20_4102 [Sugiyamaella lignohabitans]|uniref:Uncharacterized protein n=1 Tax=Sugiyamaella lignohabitans TaxID=796027 RepID=A0A161HJ14_9ASCO|nr:uncharacterized protein AWJ20_4102 [Sugiyamaella lignohabitans]ANB11298.1 hypothetical protein AWJ20_4102 [Sugiyamaella lignohabitans]
MSVVPELPGFYYDNDRKRYFRIINTGQATSQGSSDYSISAVAEVRRRRKKRNVDQNGTTSRSGHSSQYGPGNGLGVHTCCSNTSNRQGSLMSSLYPYPHGSGSSIKRYMLASSVNPRINRTAHSTMLISAMSQQAHWSLEMASTSDNLACISWSQKEQVLVLGTKEGQCSAVSGEEMVTDTTSLIVRPSNSNSTYLLGSFNSEVTSLSLSGDSMVTTSLGGPGMSGHLGCTIMKPNDASSYIQFKLPERKSAFCSAVREDPSGPYTRLAVGADTCAFCIHPYVSGAFKERFDTGSDVLAVEYVDESPSSANSYLLLAGCRSGSLNLLDPRLPSRHLTPTKPVTQAFHPSAVTHVKSLNDSRYLLVSGLEDTLALYDLRYVKPGAGPSNRTRSPYLKNLGAPSKPVLTYNGYTNLHTSRHGFAVDSACKNFAVASDDGKVFIYNIWTGDNITSRPLRKYPFFPSAVTCLEWAPSGGLFAGYGTCLQYWSWAPLTDQLA